MRDNIFKNKGLFLTLSVAIIILVYLLGYYYYRGRFLGGSMAGGYSLSGLTPERAEQRLEKQFQTSQLSFSEGENDLGFVDVSQLEVSLDAQDELKDALSKQNPYLWPLSRLMPSTDLDLSPHIQFSDGLVSSLLDSLEISNDERPEMHNAYLEKEADGNYSVVEEVHGKQINVESMEKALAKSLNAHTGIVKLEDAYIQPQKTKEGKAIADQLEEIEKMKQTSIVLEFDGHEVTVDPEAIATWIYIDEEGQTALDIEAIEEYILEDINKPYASLFQPHPFWSTYQGEVIVQPGTYGWYIDRFEEAEAIADDIRAGGEHQRTPVIAGSGYGQEDEIGPDYVEVDIDNQTMFVYINYELVLQTPIVSGMTGANTVPGAYQVWQKLEDTDLKGYNHLYDREYSTPVDYWIAFDDQAQGIHDASWQGSFGGTAYLQAGSLGCINTPPAVMGQVYELVHVGMPVMIFTTQGY